MRIHKLNVLLPALALGLCATAAVAQTVVYPPAPTTTPYHRRTNRAK